MNKQILYCVTGQYWRCSWLPLVKTLAFLLSDIGKELTVPKELIVIDERLETDKVDNVGLEGDFLCKQTPPKAHKNPVILAHSFICS